MDNNLKKVIIISAINFRAGGPLSVMQDCLSHADNYLSSHYRIIALVHNKELFKEIKNIEFIEFPKSVSSYLYRLYYEYVYFKKISLRYNPSLWLSLHDISPNVKADIRAVYCHNPAPFYSLSFKEFWLEPKFALFNFFYQYLYAINIKKNQFVIVQQEWLRKKFNTLYSVNNVIVAHPEVKFNLISQKAPLHSHNTNFYHFFFPTLPRVFKNIELICEAVKILKSKNLSCFEVTLTIDGTENRYAQSLFNQYNYLNMIHFIGRQTRDKVIEIYQNTDCLIFPSKLETWGMPITEFQNFNKPILLADLEYAHETAGNYEKTVFFNPLDSHDLAKKMEKAIIQKLKFDSPNTTPTLSPYAKNWGELFAILLRKNHAV
jgi:glycosyltransferase involved in cell wall biosynthesis